MSANLLSSSSTLSVDVVSKASGVSWPKGDPDDRWPCEGKYWLASQPLQGYCFPEYLGYADSWRWRVGAILANPKKLDSIIFAPKTMPAKCTVYTCGPGIFSESEQAKIILPRSSRPSAPATREFRFQRLEHHSINLKQDHLKRMVNHTSVQEILNRRRGRVWIITGLKIADGLEVSDGKFYRKFDSRVIFSYRLHEVRVSFTLGLVDELWGPMC